MDPYNSADARLPSQPPAIPPANPYAAPAARVADEQSYETFEKSSRRARLGAVLVDSLIVAVPVMLLAMALPMFGSRSNGQPTAAAVVLLGLLGLGLVAFVVMQLVLLHRHGQTLGKKLVGIRIVRNDGSRAGLGRILLLRGFVPGLIGAVPLVGPFFSLADVLFIFGEEKRCVHDLLADTIVVNA